MPDEQFLAGHRYVQPVFSRRGNSLLVSGVSVPSDADTRVVGKNSLETNAHLGSAVGDDNLAGVERVADSNSAAVME